MIDKLIVGVFSWILAILLAMQCLLSGLPLFRRLEYDAICHKYVLMMDRTGGLTPGQALALETELTGRGFTVDQLSGTAEADFGDELSLYVAVHYPGRQVGLSFALEEVAISFSYQTSIICRKLKSYEAG
jgi:hypothetical protein